MDIQADANAQEEKVLTDPNAEGSKPPESEEPNQNAEPEETLESLQAKLTEAQGKLAEHDKANKVKDDNYAAQRRNLESSRKAQKVQDEQSADLLALVEGLTDKLTQPTDELTFDANKANTIRNEIAEQIGAIRKKSEVRNAEQAQSDNDAQFSTMIYQMLVDGGVDPNDNEVVSKLKNAMQTGGSTAFQLTASNLVIDQKLKTSNAGESTRLKELEEENRKLKGDSGVLDSIDAGPSGSSYANDAEFIKAFSEGIVNSPKDFERAKKINEGG